LDLTGLIDSITTATANIYLGHKGFATRGKEAEGRISYEYGIEKAMFAFQEAQTTADPQTIILAEYTFLTQELQFCDKDDSDSLRSLSKAIESFDDAFLAIMAVEGSCYKAVDLATPHNRKSRISGFPKDAFHSACVSHKTRLQNILKSPGIDPIEKALLKQRLANLPVAQNSYVEKQGKALG